MPTTPLAGGRRWPASPRTAELTRVTVVGLGAIGGFVAGVLARERPELSVDGVASRPFARLGVRTREESFTVPMTLLADPSAVGGPSDWVLLATKAHQIHEVGPWLDELIGSTTRVAVLQNGVDHAERVRRWVPPERVVPVVVWLSAHREGPGRIVARSQAVLDVPADRNGLAFAELVGGGMIEPNPTDDFERAMWRKLCLNVAGGAIAAAAGRPLAQIDDTRISEIATGLVLECVAVAGAEGVELEERDYRDNLEWIIGRRTRGAPSPLQDRLAGRPIEVDARNGAVVARGRRHGIPTPWNLAMVQVLGDAHRRSEDLLDELYTLATEPPASPSPDR